MASVWGGSWGSAWDGAWGAIDGSTPPTPSPVEAVPPSGGFPAYDQGPTKAQTRRSRILHGLEAEIIAAVAQRQVEALDVDAIQQRQELEGELRLQGIEFEIRHLEALNRQREELIRSEIAMRLHQIMMEDEAAILLILAASI